MARYTECALPDGRTVFVNVERATFVIGLDGDKTLIGFGGNLSEGIVVAESPNDVLAKQDVYHQ